MSAAALPPPNRDRLAELPEARALRDAARARDWRAVHGGFDRITDPGGHDLAVYAVATGGERAAIEEHFAAYPTSPLAGTLLAARLVQDGWSIRGAGWAKGVRSEQWRGFREHLHRAEQILIEVTARCRGYTSAWIQRLFTARGLSLGQAEARRRYEALSRAAPHVYAAQRARVHQLCPKWGGSFDAMHAFAAECARSSPPGSLGAATVAVAHIEHWLLLRRDGGERAAAMHLRHPDVQNQLQWAARQSVFHPAFRPVIGWVGAHNAFAMAFSLAENHPAAAAHFTALHAGGNLASESPWEYLGDAREQFTRYRAEALRKGVLR